MPHWDDRTGGLHRRGVGHAFDHAFRHAFARGGRHRAQGLSGPTRRYAVIVLTLVVTSSLPMIAAIGVGSASVQSGTALSYGSTTPFIAPASTGPVVVVPLEPGTSGDGGWTAPDAWSPSPQFATPGRKAPAVRPVESMSATRPPAPARPALQEKAESAPEPAPEPAPVRRPRVPTLRDIVRPPRIVVTVPTPPPVPDLSVLGGPGDGR